MIAEIIEERKQINRPQQQILMKNNDIKEKDRLKLLTVTVVACMHLLIIKHLAGGLLVARKPYLIKTMGLFDRIHRLMFYAFLYLGLLVPMSSRYKLHDHVFHHVNILA